MLCWSSGLLFWVGCGWKDIALATSFPSEGKTTLQGKRKGMSAFALHLLNTDEFKPWHVSNNPVVKLTIENLWRNTTVVVALAVLWWSWAKTLFFYYSLETLTVSKYSLFLKNVSTVGEEWQSCVTISGKKMLKISFMGNGALLQDCILFLQAEDWIELQNSILPTAIFSDLQTILQLVNIYTYFKACKQNWCPSFQTILLACLSSLPLRLWAFIFSYFTQIQALIFIFYYM